MLSASACRALAEWRAECALRDAERAFDAAQRTLSMRRVDWIVARAALRFPEDFPIRLPGPIRTWKPRTHADSAGAVLRGWKGAAGPF